MTPSFFSDGEFFVHRSRAKVSAAGPLNAAKILVDGDGFEHSRVQQGLEHAAAPCRLDRINALQPVVEPDPQPVAFYRFDLNNPNHG
jgi:hypothetical protein